MLLKKIEESKNIIISSHVNPDGDAIGSGLGLFLGLRKKYPEKSIRFILEDDIPDNMKFMEETSKIEKYSELKDKPEAQVFITVDSAEKHRIGKVQELIGDSFLVNIDHHISNPHFGDLNIVKEASSTSEIIFFVLRDMLDIEIDELSGEAIYTGIITDTGNFKYESTTKETFYVAGELINTGIDRSKIADAVYKNKSLGAIKALGIALVNMKCIEEKKLVYFFLDKDFIQKEKIKKDETDGIVESLLEYKDCEVSVFLRELEDGKIKGSMRSKNKIDVNEIAKIFSGGGHKRAAGFTSDLSSEEIIKKISEKL